jgi:sulfate transport system substrate-binding protein
MLQHPKLNLVAIAEFGGWIKVQQEHFAAKGIFDQITVR